MVEITLPTDALRTVTWGLRRTDAAIRMSGGQEVFVTGRTRLWEGELDVIRLDRNEARLWMSRLFQLAKLSNHFQLTPPDYSGPSNGFSGANPTVNGAGQLGDNINVNGEAGATPLLEGDYCQIGGELKIATADLVIDGVGEGVLSFEPVLRNAAGDGSEIEIFAPAVRMRVQEPQQRYSVQEPLLFDVRFNVIETVPL